MDIILVHGGVAGVFAVLAITIVASFVKGAIGFAMPMIMVSGLATFLPADLALALLIVPTLATNVVQAFGDGVGAARASALRFGRYLAVVLVFIAISAQLVAVLPQSALYLLIGLPVMVFSLWQLAGRPVTVPPGWRARVEIGLGALAGFVGGVSGVWGPPTVLYLTAIGTRKDESVRVQGVIYLAGAIVLTLAHLRSGVLNGETLPLSAALILPSAVGMALGARTRGRMDEAQFRRWTLVVLIVAGANLVRRGLL